MADSKISKYPYWRSLLLCSLLLLSILLYLLLSSFALPSDAFIQPFLLVWIICFLPYFAACAVVLATRPPTGRWSLVELAIILSGALLFRLLLLPQLPWLSHDSWRYLWDARVTLNGFSPYIYPPDSKILEPLRNSIVFANSGFHDVPTIYPPGALSIYILSYLLAPDNMLVLKAIFIGFDMVTCLALALLLQRRGLDPRRVIIYAWCPLPIIEFAIEGHVDALTLPFIVLALLTASSSWRGSRALTGFLIALGMLTKIYPIILLVVVVRRRDWVLLATCLSTILLAYIPFILLGHGQILGFFLTYAGQQQPNGGVIQLFLRQLSSLLGLSVNMTILVQYGIDLLIMILVIGLILLQRQRGHISMEGAFLLLVGIIFAISSHIYPWYTSVLLLGVATLIEPLWDSKGISARGLAIAATWYFVCTVLCGYFFRTSGDWNIYYLVVYGVVTIGLGAAALIALAAYRCRRRQFKHI